MDGLNLHGAYADMLSNAQQSDEPQVPVDQTQNNVDVPKIDVPDNIEPDSSSHQEPFYSLGDDYVAPESFDNTESELEWYKEKYNNVVNNFTSEDFYNKVFENYKDLMLAKMQDADRMKETYEALQRNPKEFIRQYFPESLAEIGVTPVMDDNELSATVDRRLKEEFGDNYSDLYNVNDLAPFKGNTLSRQIQTRGDAIYAELVKQNDKNREIFENYTKNIVAGREPVSEERIKNYVEEQYQEFAKSGMDRENYDAFVSELNGYVPTMQDVFLMKNVPLVHKIGYEDGYEAAKKEFAKNVSRISTKVDAPANKQPTIQTGSGYEDYISKATKNGYLPINY